MACNKKSAIYKDLSRGPIYFRKKANALDAKESATKNGIRTRLSKTTFMGNRWKLSKA